MEKFQYQMRWDLDRERSGQLDKKNIDGWMGMLLSVTKVNTLKDLSRVVSNTKSMSSANIPSFMGSRLQRKTEAKETVKSKENLSTSSTKTSRRPWSSDPELTTWWLRIPDEILYDRC
jgi:hypothetical protein